jgi:hypothetical protein
MRLMDVNAQLVNDVHFLVAPLRFLWRSILTLLFLLLAPILFAIVPVLAVRYASPDEIWLLKWAFGVLGPFASTFWFLIIAMIPAHDRGERGLAFHLKSFGAMAVGFLVSAGTMFSFATNYEVCYVWDDRAWFTGAWLCLLSPFALLFVWRLLTHVSFGRN